MKGDLPSPETNSYSGVISPSGIVSLANVVTAESDKFSSIAAPLDNVPNEPALEDQEATRSMYGWNTGKIS